MHMDPGWHDYTDIFRTIVRIHTDIITVHGTCYKRGPISVLTMFAKLKWVR